MREHFTGATRGLAVAALVVLILVTGLSRVPHAVEWVIP